MEVVAVIGIRPGPSTVANCLQAPLRTASRKDPLAGNTDHRRFPPAVPDRNVIGLAEAEAGHVQSIGPAMLAQLPPF